MSELQQTTKGGTRKNCCMRFIKHGFKRKPPQPVKVVKIAQPELVVVEPAQISIEIKQHSLDGSL